MEHDFWHNRWNEGRLGFHQQKVNSRLKQFWDAFAAGKGQTVFIPLCGKSLDMLWLAENGYTVFGVELSDIACRDFYREHKLRYHLTENPCTDTANKNRAPLGNPQNYAESQFIKFVGRDIEIWCGNFFDLKADDMRDIHVVYDRAALIALPQAMRGAYASHLASLLHSRARVFLISMEYDENKMNGPPFSVPEEEIHDLFASQFSVEILTQSCGPDIVGNLAERGLDTLHEKVYGLERL